MKAHPIAEPFPLLKEIPLKNLADNIEANGLLEPIILLDGMILDGRNRLAACKMAKVEPRFEEYTGIDPINYVVSRNLHRRHLSTAERAEIGAKLAKLEVGRPKKAPNGAISTETTSQVSLTQAEAAKTMGVSERSVERAAAKLRGPKKPSSRKPKTSGWTTEEAKKDEQLFKALTAIVEVYGKNDTMEIRKGTIGLSKADIIALSKLAKSQMLAIQDLIMANHWTPKKALKFLTKKPDGRTTVEQLHNYCLGTPDKKWKAVIGGFSHIVIANIK